MRPRKTTRTKGCKFAEVLEKLMEQKGETTYSLADKLGTLQPTLAQYKTCKRIPKPSVVEEIARTMYLTKKQKRKLYEAYLSIAFSEQGIKALKGMKEIDEQKIKEWLESAIDKLGGTILVAERAGVSELPVRKFMQLNLKNMRVLDHKGTVKSILKVLNPPPKIEAGIIYLYLKDRKAEDILKTLTEGSS